MKRYDVVINGVQTTLQLSDADAEARGIKPQGAAKNMPAAAAPAAEAMEKAKTPANKARQPANKSRARTAAPKA